ncbi:hypothetical protein G7Y89_g12812 [Cudoniella acicularis]|uniref:Uncharacterized protein n=1 Tax=Cudoniella acicularis TaxID=354080 RepID=A0A8H4R8E8_9HELO|nr:hypothetical protein G7Y89_g12812 [Cudoniella acicularis]
MDPLSITASAIAVLQISGAIITTCYSYRSRVRNAAQDAKRIVNELNSLRSVIEFLFVLLEDHESAVNKTLGQYSALQELGLIDGLLATCEAELKALEGWRAKKAEVFWPLKEGDFALAADQRRAALAIQNGIEFSTEQFSVSVLTKVPMGGMPTRHLEKLLHDQGSQERARYVAEDARRVRRIDHTSHRRKHQESALKILQLLCFTARPVSVQEVAEVLAINLNEHPCYDPDLKPLDPRDILSLCSTLVTRAAFSMADDPEVLPTYDEYDFDVVCDSQAWLVYLLQPTFASGHCDLDTLANRLQQWPLYHYAAHFWPFHVNASSSADDDLNEETWRLLHQFFSTRNSTASPRVRETYCTQPLYYAASFGIMSLIRKLLDSDPDLDINAKGSRFDSTPVQVATYRNHPAAVKLLLEGNANPMVVGSYGQNCLLITVLGRYAEVRELLRDYGVTWTEADADLLRRVVDRSVKERAEEETEL